MKNYLILLIICFSTTSAFSQLQLAIETDTAMGCSPLLCTFTGSGDSSITTWHWNFGDGDTSNLQNPSHLYASPFEFMSAIYDVTLIASNGVDTDSLIMIAFINIWPKPIASFSVSSISATELSFTDLTFADTLWVWDFGDGNTSTSQNPTHDYGTIGTYDVTLMVQNFYGCKDTVTITDIFGITGVTEHIKDKYSARLFPNPVSRHDNLKFVSDNNSIDYIEIMEMTGRKLWQLDFKKGETIIIPTDDLTTGMYLCRLIDVDRVVKVHKFLVR